MTVYLVGFSLTLLFAYINERNLLKKHPQKTTQIITAVLVITIPALIAGLRDYSIGFDVQVYAKTVFENATLSSDIFELFNRFESMEKGFLLIAYLVSRFFSDVHFFLFFISIFIQIFIYLSLYRTRKFCSIFIGESVYLFIMFNASLNIMRQSIAMAIILFALTHIFDRKFFKAIIWISISCLFHSSACLAFLFIIIFIFTNEKPNLIEPNITKIITKNNYFLKTIIMISITIFVVVLFIPITTLLIEKGFINASYLRYLQIETMSFNWKFMLVYILPYPIVFMMRKKNQYGYTLLTMGVIDIISYQLQFVMYYLFRISTYFMIVRIFSLSQFRIDFYRIIVSKKIRKEEIVGIIVILICFIYWISFIVINNDNSTVPYKFFFK